MGRGKVVLLARANFFGAMPTYNVIEVQRSNMAIEGATTV